MCLVSLFVEVVLCPQAFAEVSHFGNALRTHGLHGFYTSRIAPDITARERLLFVLSGQFSAAQSNTIRQLPQLEQEPIVEKLFESQDFRQERQDLVLFFTPHVVTHLVSRVQRTSHNVQKLDGRTEGFVGRGVLD